MGDNMYRIFSDSGSDLSSEMAAQIGVEILPLHSVMTDAKGTTTIDGTKLPLPEFYQLLRERYSAKTAAVNSDAFSEAFRPVLEAGEDVIYLGLSSGLSTTVNAARIAAEDLVAEYPDRTVIVVDTLAASLGEGLMVYLAAKKRDGGASIEELHSYLLEIRPHLCHWFTVDDLFFLKRGGRVSAATALVGTALGIKPIMHVDDEGHLVKVETARGRRKSVTALFEKMVNAVVDPDGQAVFISHGDCREDAEYLASLIREKYAVDTVIIDYVGQVIGTHSGPGTLALFYLGSQR